MSKGEEKLEKNMQLVKKNGKTKQILWIFVRSLLIAIFIGTSIWGNMTHERWGDEAQAWLLARDASVSEIVFQYVKPEGSPVSWHLILKFAITLGLDYSFYGIIPLVFTVIGLILLEFKLKVPWYIKILLPFTYYIFYQYNIIARSYCMLFPTLCYIALVYPNRAEKPIQYALGLALLSSICLHGCLLSGTLFVLYLLEYLSKRLKEEKSIRSILAEKKVWVPFLILGLYYCFLIYTLIPQGEIPVFTKGKDLNFWEKTAETIGEASISSKITEKWVNVVGCILTGGITILFLTRAKKEDQKMIFLLVPILVLFLTYYCNAWHIGILTEVLFFVWYIFYQGMSEKTKLWEKTVLLVGICFILVMQVLWSGKAFLEENRKIYSHGHTIAEVLKEPVQQGKKIYGLQYSVTAILPYFEKNIFANFPNEDESFYHWIDQRENPQTTEEILEGEADIYVISEAYLPYYVDLMEKLREKGYTLVRYSSALLVKGNTYEYSGYVLASKE